MAEFTRTAWESPEGELDASDYCACCLVDLNKAGVDKVKDNCKLPVRSRPGGAYNVNALHAAAAALAGARGGLKGVPAEEKKAAARKLVKLYREADEVATEAVYRIAGMRRPD